MKLSKKKPEPTQLELETIRLLTALEKQIPGSEDYDNIQKQLVKMYEIDASLPKEAKLSKDTVASGIFSLSGIAAIIAFEKIGNGILTSKAMSLLPKVILRR